MKYSILACLTVLVLMVGSSQARDEPVPIQYAIKAGKILTMAPKAGSSKDTVVINHGVILMKDGKAYVQAGAGIVADSDPEKEYAETQNKARALLRSIELVREYEG